MRPRSTLAIAAAMAITVGLSGAPVMAAPATTSAGGPSLAWALPHFAVGRQVGWLLSAGPKAPLPVKEIKQHFDKTFLAQVPPAQINKVLEQIARASKGAKG